MFLKTNPPVVGILIIITILKSKTDDHSKKELDDLEELMADKMSENMFNIVKNEVEKIDSEEGGFHSGHLRKLKSKLRPKPISYPTAIYNSEGDLVTSLDDIEKVTETHFHKVLENRPIKPHLESYQKEREQLCEQRIEEAKKCVTPPWEITNERNVIRNLKSQKSRDPYGYSNEMFKYGGSDFQLAILKLMNQIKAKQIFPEALQPCNITSLYKNKGTRKDLNNYRGIFRVNIFRNILDRLIYEDEYENLDLRLTDSNVGGRKGRNIVDNIFVINAITNSIRNGNEESCDVKVYDVEKCFDSLWAQECINTLYEIGLKNDKLVLLYEESKSAKIAIKTATGITERKSIYNVIMQGSVFGTLICTCVMDKLAKLFYNDPNLLYKYKNDVDIPVLEMVDDVISVNKCSEKSLISNATISTFMDLNKLKLSEPKCSKIDIGKKCDQCPQLYVNDKPKKEIHGEKYLGDMISSDGKLDKTIQQRTQKAYTYLAEIKALL